MIEVTAYKDESGAVHLTKLEAARADARIALQSVFDGPAESCIAAIMSDPVGVHEALKQLAAIIRLEKAPKERA